MMDITYQSLPIYPAINPITIPIFGIGSAVEGWFSDIETSYWNYWSAENWNDWYLKLHGFYGKDEANKRFIEAYYKAPELSVVYDWRNFNSAFIKQAKEYGYYKALFDGIGGLVGQAISTGVNVTHAAADTAQALSAGAASLASSANDESTSIFKLIPWILFGVLLLFLLTLVKSFLQVFGVSSKSFTFKHSSNQNYSSKSWKK